MSRRSRNDLGSAASASRIGVFLVAAGLTGCGSEAEDPGQDEKTGHGRVTASASTSTESEGERQAIPVTVSRAFGSTDSFALNAPADGYEVQMTNCLSGYGATVTQANTDGIEVYTYDRGCLAKLTQFTYDSKTYYPTVGDPFTTWQPGDHAIFDEAGAPGTAPFAVTIVSTLQNPVAETDTVIYRFSELLAGSSRSILWASIGASGQVSGPHSPPSYTIRSIELTGLSGAEGGQFKLVMECTSNIGVTNECVTVNFADLDYKIVEDEYGGAPDSTACGTIFSSAGTSVTLPDHRVAPGDLGTTRGGFITAVITGPANLATHEHLLFVIRSYGDTYQYFNIDIAVAPNY